MMPRKTSPSHIPASSKLERGRSSVHKVQEDLSTTIYPLTSSHTPCVQQSELWVKISQGRGNLSIQTNGPPLKL